MSRFGKMLDLYFTDGGDYALGENGDLEDTRNEHYRGFIQAVVTRVLSTRGDWKLQPTLGASITEFLGQQNTRAVGERIRSRVYNELTASGLMRSSDFVVDVFPVTATSIAIGIIVNAQRPEVVLTFTYDFRDNKVIPRNV